MKAPYRRIACFIDQDVASESALAEAQRLREFGDCELDLVHVAPDPLALYSAPYAYLSVSEDFYPRAREWIEERARRAGARPVLLSGFPARAACEFATSARVDLMIAAAHRGVVRRAVLGGFASHIAYHAPCPVLLVHPPLAEGEMGEAGGHAVATVNETSEGEHMAEQPDPITTDHDLGERVGQAEDRLSALEREVEALREQLRTVAALGGERA